MKKLVAALLIVAAFGAGFTFDRWLHRPIEIHVTHFGLVGPPNTDLSCGLPWNICWKTT